MRVSVRDPLGCVDGERRPGSPPLALGARDGVGDGLFPLGTEGGLCDWLGDAEPEPDAVGPWLAVPDAVALAP